MNLWSVFATGLLAGGASCAVVQGGLLAGAVARRHDARPDTSRSRLDDVVPVGGFLAGKLVSHTLAGALLGLIGDAAQLGFRTRAAMQIGAGVLMILMAAHLLGLRALRKLVPAPPAAVTRFIRRSARSEAVVTPAILGFLTILIPCGVTLSVMVLAVASGSPVTGAVGMALFVLGTSPLFAALGYGLRRSADLLRGYLAKAAAVAVIVVGVLSINSGLVLRGSSFTLERAWDRVLGRDETSAAMEMGNDMGMGGSDMPAADNSAVMVDAAGVQRIRIEVRATSYSPSRVQARGGLPTKLIMRTNNNRKCTQGLVIPAMNLERTLAETGETEIDLGTPAPGRIDYVCSAGMYRGVIEVL